jgi:hypothetical protein
MVDAVSGHSASDWAIILASRYFTAGELAMINFTKIAVLLLTAPLHVPLTGTAFAADGVEPVDLYIPGDHHTESLVFAHVDDRLGAMVLRFTGNAFSEVGAATLFVHFDWFDPAPHRVTLGEFELPGTTADDVQILVPIDVQFTLPSSPTMVGLSIEGTGCCDQFRVQGEFEHSVVPEPSSVLLISLGLAGLLAHQVRRRKLRFNRSIA